jgi:mono/diheme cytochrome c family protein
MNRDRSFCLANVPIRSGAATLLALSVIVRFAAPTIAQQDNVGEGQRIWAEKGQCQECHGWAGNGERSTLHAEGKAPSLRLTQLTRDQIRTTIQCGRPGTAMPHFDRFAYTDKRCYDMTAAELGDAVPNRAAATLQPYEIDALADFIEVKVKGAGPVTRSQCAAFFKENAGIRCERYPDK